MECAGTEGFQQVTQMADGDGVLWPKLETGPLFVSLQLGATRRKRDGWSVSITLWGS